MTRFAQPAEFQIAEPVALPSGRCEGMRRLRTSDTAAFRDHLLRLDARGRRLRFGSPVNDAFIERYAADALTDEGCIIGLFSDGILRGAAELCGLGRDGAKAEAAFSLEADLRGRGLGSRLFEEILAEARRAGIRSLAVHFLRENVAMRKIVARHSPKLEIEGAEVTATIRLDMADRLAPLRPLGSPAPVSLPEPA
ncbi:GNAT family N-acetyltransferase [Aureimonas mangrovi]|uniref:GNAT family N-acetyltransferase n=1 Tax=Aureimonas mangrovi TaxID=2758041 RepID=UPI00163DBDD5|nr:GNAT family N-acetyltransferase [Aureimonas mangrovi]